MNRIGVLFCVLLFAGVDLVCGQTVTPPRISAVTPGQTVNEGQNVSITVSIAGTSPLTYLWRKGGLDVLGATNAAFTLAAARGSDAGSYTVVVSNSAGAVTVGPIVLNVLVAVSPVVESLVFPSIVYLGSSFMLPLSVKGTAPFTYQWLKDGVPLLGETRSSFSRSATTAVDVGTYSVVVTNAVGSTTSLSGYLSVSLPPRPIITESPSSLAANLGDTLSLSVTAVGARPGLSDDESGTDLEYQWRRNDIAIVGATGRNYRFTVVAGTNSKDAFTVLVSNRQGAVLSAPAFVTVLPPSTPVISGHPASQVVRQGDEIVLSVDAQGTILPTYRWTKDGGTITGATASTYTKPGAVVGDAGSYTVVVTNGVGSLTSAPARVTVLAAVAPVITSHPASSSLPPSDFVPYLSIDVRSSIPVTYQWRKDGTPIAGANNSRTYSLAAPQPASAGSYTVVVSNAAGTVTSNPAIVTVDATPPLINYTGGGEVVSIGDYLRLDLLLAVETATIQWRKDGVVVLGAVGSSLVLPSLTSANAGSYVATVTAGGFPSATSRPITVEILDLGLAPRLLLQPAAQTRPVSSRVTFTAASDGERPFTYQWRKDAVAIPGATGATFAINSAVAASAGSYSVAVTNRNGSVTSDAVPLVVTDTVPLTPPVILAQPASLVLFENESGNSLSVVLASPIGVSYQWRKNGANIPGATLFTYAISPEASVAGRYSVIATNAAGAATSQEATVSVVDFPDAPQFTLQPAGETVLPGTTVTFSARAIGSTAVSYQWRRNGVELSGATGATLVLPYVSAAATGTYTVVATNLEGVASSAAAPLMMRTTPLGPPVITAQPAATTVIPNGNLTLTAGVAANPPATYQWFLSGQTLPGETAQTVVLSNVTAAGTYTFSATNSQGTVTSAPTSIRLTAPIEFGSTPPDQVTPAGSSVTLSAPVQSSSNLGYQWRKNGVAVPGATSATLAFAAAKSSDAGSYTLTATHGEGSQVSSPITLTVTASPFAGVYAGTFSSGEPFALSVSADAVSALLGSLAITNQAVIVRGFIVQPNGSFTATGETITRQLAAFYPGTITGVVKDGTVTGALATTKLTFSGALKSSTGAAAAVVGYYHGVAVATTLGEMHAVASADGALLLVALDPTGARSASGQVGANGAFSVVQASYTYSGNLGLNGAPFTGTFQLQGGVNGALAAPGAPDGVERLANVSTRSLAGSGARTLIAGFAVNGTAPKDVLVRATGPALTLFGVPGTLPNPRLRIFKDSRVLFDNDDWTIGGSVGEISAATARLGAFPLGIGSLDAALLVRLDPGSYTAQVSSDAVAAGVALVEVYDASAGPAGAQKLINVSTRADVGTGGDILIVGVVVAGNAPKKLLIRGIGPSLAEFGVTGALATPRLQLYRGNQLLRENTGWSAGTDSALIAVVTAQVGAFPLTAGSKDCALLLYLAPGSYTAQIGGVANTTGVALVEVYEVP